MAVVSGVLMLLAVAAPVRAYAAIVPAVNMRTVTSFSVLGGQTVTNTGPSKLAGDLGVSPGDAITGFPPGTVAGATYKGNAVALQAQKDLTRAYNDADGRPKVGDSGGNVPVDLVGLTLAGGVYESAGALGLTGELTLDGEDNPDSVWIFKSSSTLITGSGSKVTLTNGADACNVFWQVDSSATIATNSDFVGTIMALASVTVQTGATVDGRALARTGAVTLDNNVFQDPACDDADESPSTTPTVTVTATPRVTVTPPPVTTTATVTATITEVPAGGESVAPTVTITQRKTVEVPVAGESVTKTVTAPVNAGGNGGDQSNNGTGGGNNNGGTDNGSGGDSTGYLASTGSDVMSPYLGVAGLALLLVGGLLLARGHGRTRTSGKHR